MPPVKRMPITEFRSLGYLQETNRRFLHPHGLALEVSTGWTRAEVEQLLAAGGVQFGPGAIDCVMTFLGHAGLAAEYLGVWDYREDRDGIRYELPPEEMAVMAQRAADLEAIWASRRDARRAALGYVVQPLG